MKSFNQFLSEAINIAGDFNGNLYINGSEPQSEPVGESFFADVVWEGKMYRLEVKNLTYDGLKWSDQTRSHASMANSELVPGF